MHFDEEMGFQYLGPGITVLSPSDPRAPTVSGVFGAGKTRSAATLLAGLLVFDPSIQRMVLTKKMSQPMLLLNTWYRSDA